jgi:hypothetical protein
VVCVTRKFDLFRFRRLSPDEHRRGGGRFKLDHLSGILADPSLRRFPIRKSRVASEFGCLDHTAKRVVRTAGRPIYWDHHILYPRAGEKVGPEKWKK